MSSFIHSLKFLRYVGSIYKHHVRINDVHTNCRNLSHVLSNVTSQRSELTNRLPRYKANDGSQVLHIDNIIKQIDEGYKITGRISKSSIEKIIQSVVETAGQIETSQALLALRCNSFLPQCTPQERIKLTDNLWKLLNMYNVPMDVSHYNALLQVYVENGHEFSPLEVLAAMKKQGTLPNKATYKWLLEYYCRKGNMSESSVILECMKEENYPINESIFNLLILGYSQAGDLTSAINILDIMKKMDVIPSGETYTAVMCAYAKVNDIKSINEILSLCEKQHIQFSNKQILDVIYTLIINNNMDHVDEMLTKLKKPSGTAEINFLSKVMDTRQDIATNIFFSILSKNRRDIIYNDFAYFFINKLMHSNACPESIVDACIHFETEYDDKNAFHKAIYFSFRHNNDLVSLSLLKAWKNRGCKLRPHYFWPILTKLVQKNDIQGVLHNVKDMVTEYNVIPCIDTLTDFVIPHVFYNILTIRNELHKYGIPSKVVDNSIIYEFLRNGKMRRAASHVTRNPNIYQESILKNVLNRALHVTCDVNSFLMIARNMYKETESGEEKQVSINEAILDMMDFINARPNYVTQIIEFLNVTRLKISNDVYKALSRHLGDDSSPDMLKQLANITEDSGIKQKGLQVQKKQVRVDNSMPGANNSPVFNSVKQSYRNFLILKKERNFSIPSFIYVRLVTRLLEQNYRTEAKTVMKHLITDYPVILTLKFVLKHIPHFILMDHINDAVELVQYTKRLIKVENNEELRFYFRSLFATLASMGNDKVVNNFVEILLKEGYLEMSEDSLRPLIMVYIREGNAVKLLDIAESLGAKFGCVPAFTELTNSIILAKDANLLQRFIDVTTKFYEQPYVLGELLLCFLQNDCEKEAKKTIELLATSNYDFTSMKLNIFRRIRQKNTSVLEKLLDCSVEYPKMRRLFVYKVLLRAYDVNNDHQSALQLWAKIIKEGALPSENFARDFWNLLERNNIDKSLIPKIGFV